MPANRCFVISPIGAEGSPTRLHADNVFDFIIKPAVEECGLTAVRSDHLHEPGKIHEQMFREILSGACCVAVLTDHNPNVFYELALAQAAGTPVVTLLEKQQLLPFDVFDHRCIRYDLELRALAEKKYATELARQLAFTLAAGSDTSRWFNELSLTRLRRVGLPEPVLAELVSDWATKRKTLSDAQRLLLSCIELRGKTPEGMDQNELAEASGINHHKELFYRLEQLRMLGFVEMRPRGPALTAGYRENLPWALEMARPSSGAVPIPMAIRQSSPDSEVLPLDKNRAALLKAAGLEQVEDAPNSEGVTGTPSE